MLGAADAGLAILKPLELYKTTYPNKVFDYMAAGIPVILAIDGVIRQVVEAAGGGVFVQPGDPQALAASIRNLARHPDKARRMGQAGCRYVRTNFNRQDTAIKFEELLEQLEVKVTDKILVVEDEIPLQETLVYNLEKQGYLVATASDGKIAIDQARSFHPDLILLDVMLPVMDGFEVCRVIRQEMNTPIIMLTARAEEIDRVVGLEVGADDYLSKPFSMRELLARVKALLRRVRLMTETITRVQSEDTGKNDDPQWKP